MYCTQKQIQSNYCRFPAHSLGDLGEAGGTDTLSPRPGAELSLAELSLAELSYVGLSFCSFDRRFLCRGAASETGCVQLVTNSLPSWISNKC